MLQSFSATVLTCQEEKGGWAVTLSATAFYPEGGGQPCDLGTLGEARVLDVRERDGAILHLCDRPLTPGQTLEGHIDWERRLDLMQQHTGEHILSGLIHRRFGWHNIGFHLGATTVQIDFDGPIPPEALAELEQQANRVLWEDRPVNCSYPDPEALATIPYRSKKQLPWPVRIVEIPGADICACCGTHLPTAGMVGLIKILSAIKFHEGVRLEIVCGGRALQYLTAVYEQNRQVSQTFSAKLLETGEAARRSAEALASEKYRATALQNRLFDYIAKDYVNQKQILHFEPGLDGAGVRTLAEKLTAVCDGVCAVFSEKEEGFSYCLASRTEDLHPLCKALNQALSGRGGGKPNFCQGSVTASREAIEAFFAN
jgi:alanyl-tRNA synthetase